MNHLSPTLPSSVHIEATGLRLADTVSDEEIAETFRAIEQVGQHINWFHGDLMREVARVRPTRRVQDKIDDGQLHFTLAVEKTERVDAMIQMGLTSQSTARTACRVSTILDLGERVPNLSWGHHECALAECGLLGGDCLTGGEYQSRKREALAFLAWCEGERRAGEIVSVSEFRTIIRLRRSPMEKKEDDFVPAWENHVGEVLRETQRCTQYISRIKVEDLQDYDRAEVRKALEPIVNFYQSLGASIGLTEKKESLTD